MTRFGAWANTTVSAVAMLAWSVALHRAITADTFTTSDRIMLALACVLSVFVCLKEILAAVYLLAYGEDIDVAIARDKDAAMIRDRRAKR